jgi:hypothetical protein
MWVLSTIAAHSLRGTVHKNPVSAKASSLLVKKQWDVAIAEEEAAIGQHSKSDGTQRAMLDVTGEETPVTMDFQKRGDRVTITIGGCNASKLGSAGLEKAISILERSKTTCPRKRDSSCRSSRIHDISRSQVFRKQEQHV